MAGDAVGIDGSTSQFLYEKKVERDFEQKRADEKAAALTDQSIADKVPPKDGAYESAIAAGGGAIKALLQFFTGVLMFIIIVMVLAVVAYGASQVMQVVARPLAKFIGTTR